MVTTVTATSTATAEIDAICDERDFYVDATGGDNTKDGRTPATAWKTIGRVNAETFVAGDHIYFKRGETFSGRLIPDGYGEDGNWIVFADYDSGALPIIDGSAASALYINSTTRHHIRFENIDFSGSAGAATNVADVFTHDMYFYNCIFRDSGYGGLAVWHDVTDGGGANIYNVTIDTCVIHDNGDIGLYVGAAEDGPYNCEIKYCTAYNNALTAPTAHGIYTRQGVNTHHCVSYDNAYGGIKCNDEDDTDSPYLPEIYNNICYGNKVGIVASNHGAKIHDNLLYSNQMNILDYGVPDMEFYFNTLVNGTSTSYGNIYFYNAALTSNSIYKNNIFVQDEDVTTVDYIFFINSGTFAQLAANNTFENNIYYKTDTNPTTTNIIWQGTPSLYFDWTDWQGQGKEVNGVLLTAEPDFVTPYSDLHPANAGNLDGHDGVAITGYEYDLDGNLRADPPNCGCYEEASA